MKRRNLNALYQAIGAGWEDAEQEAFSSSPNQTAIKAAPGQMLPERAVSDQSVKKRFGLALKAWRKKVGISQEELAWRAQLHRTYVSGIETGDRNLSLTSIEKLAKALKLSFSTLFQPLGDSPGADGKTTSVNGKKSA